MTEYDEIVEIMARTMLAESEFLADSVSKETLSRCIDGAITALIEAGYGIAPSVATAPSSPSCHLGARPSMVGIERRKSHERHHEC